MTDLLDLVVLESLFAWLGLIATVVAIFVVPPLFGLKTINALVFAQMTLVFNAVTVIAGYHADMVDASRTLHFFFNEFAFLALTCYAYRQVLRHRERVVVSITAFFSGRGAVWLTRFMGLVALFYFVVVPTDGESRIAYMTAGWFSLLKPFLQIASPLAFMGVIVMLMLPARRKMGFVLLFVTLAANVFTGSKASFLFALATALLALRDLSMYKRLRLRRADLWKLGAIAVPLTVFALARLEVGPADVAARFLLFGEATILTYFSDTPTEACQDVSTLASMHRGVARVLGDASANDIDTLFGFALTKLHLGINTFTGPNGRLSAYMICNFPGAKLMLGWLVVGIYFGLMALLFRRALRRPLHMAIVYPYIVTSYGFASQDFNLIMADITLAVLLLLTTIPLAPPRKRYALG